MERESSRELVSGNCVLLALLLLSFVLDVSSGAAWQGDVPPGRSGFNMEIDLRNIFFGKVQNICFGRPNSFGVPTFF